MGRYQKKRPRLQHHPPMKSNLLTSGITRQSTQCPQRLLKASPEFWVISENTRRSKLANALCLPQHHHICHAMTAPVACHPNPPLLQTDQIVVTQPIESTLLRLKIFLTATGAHRAYTGREIVRGLSVSPLTAQTVEDVSERVVKTVSSLPAQEMTRLGALSL